jgi:hypothetical protein
MTYHIVCLAGPDDQFSLQAKHRGSIVFVPFDSPEHPDHLQTTIPDVFAKFGVTPSTDARDFLNAACAAYTADVRTARNEAYDNWTRDFVLYLPVRDVDKWAAAAGTLEQLLSFLTGDRWTVNPRQAPKPYQPISKEVSSEAQLLTTRTVCLFSGGLDSFVGAVEQIERVGQVALVAHHSAGGGATSRSQKSALSALRAVYDEELTPFFQLWMSPPVGESRASETTTRGRSIIFLGLGVAVASGLRAERLVVPENGVISLNVPLTNSRLGSFSTRTTHPYLIALVRELLAALGIEVEIELPYRFQTKGELLKNCSNKHLVKAGVEATMSCSHPGANRFTKVKNPNAHCGYCIPCIIRRAAVRHAKITDPTLYAFDDLSELLSKKRRLDLRAVRMALDKYRRQPPRVADILAAGPLPATDVELNGYLNVFKRGLDEVRRFLRQYE